MTIEITSVKHSSGTLPYVRAGQAVRHDSPPGDERTILATNTGLQPAGPGRHTGIMILL